MKKKTWILILPSKVISLPTYLTENVRWLQNCTLFILRFNIDYKLREAAKKSSNNDLAIKRGGGPLRKNFVETLILKKVPMAIELGGLNGLVTILRLPNY